MYTVRTLLILQLPSASPVAGPSRNTVSQLPYRNYARPRVEVYLAERGIHGVLFRLEVCMPHCQQRPLISSTSPQCIPSFEDLVIFRKIALVSSP